MTGTSRIPRGPADLPAAAPSETGPGAQKKALRQQLAARRAAIDPADRALWDAAIGQQLLDWQQQEAIATLGVYWPLQGEVDLTATYAALAARGVALLLPVVVARDAALAFTAWTPGEPMHKDAMGVAVPAVLRPSPLPPALLVPCLGFDAHGYRLGYGGGYYDRTLATPPRPRTIGIAYRCQQAVFATLAHDVPLDMVLTEARPGPAAGAPPP